MGHINGNFYVLLWLRKSIKTKFIGKLTKRVLFHQDNAQAQKVYVSKASVDECGFELVDHPCSSPDLTLSSYHLFPSIKNKSSLHWELVSQWLRNFICY